MKYKLTPIVLMFIISCQQKENSIDFTFTKDGAWCWFSDPRALYIEGENPSIISGWVKKNGTIEAGLVTLKDLNIDHEILYTELEKDDHDNPAFAQFPDNTLFASYAWHSTEKGILIQKGSVYNHKLTFEEANQIRPFDTLTYEIFPKKSYTYTNPYILKDENERIYCFGRWIGFKPNVIWSDDYGDTWTDPKVVIAPKPFNGNNRPYVKYYSDGKSRIHIAFTDGHPRVEPLNSIYYAYYEGGSFFKADGTKICDISDLPFEPKDATIVYKADSIQGRAWIWDITADNDQIPTIAFTKLPSETDHKYFFSSFDGANWEEKKICDGGKWFPMTPGGEVEREPHYSGGITIHPSKKNVFFLSREVDTTFEIERWELIDDIWNTLSVTSDSPNDNIRPYVPRGLPDDQEIVLWMENRKYIHYTQFDASIKGKILD